MFYFPFVSFHGPAHLSYPPFPLPVGPHPTGWPTGQPCLLLPLLPHDSRHPSPSVSGQCRPPDTPLSSSAAPPSATCPHCWVPYPFCNCTVPVPLSPISLLHLWLKGAGTPPATPFPPAPSKRHHHLPPSSVTPPTPQALELCRLTVIHPKCRRLPCSR
jgi:hypothetical protein